MRNVDWFIWNMRMPNVEVFLRNTDTDSCFGKIWNTNILACNVLWSRHDLMNLLHHITFDVSIHALLDRKLSFYFSGRTSW